MVAYLSPLIRAPTNNNLRDQGSKITLEEKQQSLHEIETFRQWFTEGILTHDNDTASTAIMVLPAGIGEPWYRDVPFDNQKPTIAWGSMVPATLLGLPHLVIPSKFSQSFHRVRTYPDAYVVGQIPFTSRNTNRTDYLPVTTSLVAAKGNTITNPFLRKWRVAG